MREDLMSLYIGLMSGTSADGIDAAIVDFSQKNPRLIATHYTPYPASVREKILSLCTYGDNEIERLGELDYLLGKAFANAVNAILKQENLSADDIKAIGSHGQTIRHRPRKARRFTLQIGDPNIIAAETGITTIADFRRKDMALHGQGAPLVPAFHQTLFASNQHNCAVINIGGIANVTLLLKNSNEVIGFDTGPGNALMDAWIATHQNISHDQDGKWAAQGTIHSNLLTQLLSDNYFALPHPKSTGREYFNLAWLQNNLSKINGLIAPQDVQATLSELTAHSILIAIRKLMSDGDIFICGGGVHNHFLLQRLQTLAAPAFTVASTTKKGIDPDWIEAMAFAWLAKQTLEGHPGNLPSVTGATRAAILGGIYYC